MKIKKLVIHSGTVVALIASVLLTAYIFLNSYETIALQDISYISAIKTVHGRQLSDILNQYTIAPADEDRLTGITGTPYILKIPSQNVGVRLSRSIEKNHQWLSQANRAHYLIVRSDGDSNIEHLLIYVNRSWQTINQPAQIQIKDNIYVDTSDGWRYFYRISRRDSFDLANQYIAPASATPLLILLVEEPQQQTAYIYVADFINVQNISQ